ncbi:hypothetical protein [Hyphomonas oceanitis]|uniref:hypothetical protein n=1 Tax=Hyphomonas oceanitis TaxID=81033 RepID=UPI0030039051
MAPDAVVQSPIKFCGLGYLLDDKPNTFCNMSTNELSDIIACSFIDSAEHDGFNGIVASRLLRVVKETERLTGAIAELIETDRITAVFACTSVNMHIKRLPDLPKSTQVELLGTEALDTVCLYPAASEVQKRVDLTNWHDRPFSKCLLLAEPQLHYRAFEMSAIERYVADPRYVFEFDDYMGWMSVDDAYFRDEEHPERDKTSLQTFGLGFDAQRIPYIIVFLRYLAGLSPEHQQYWQSYLVSGDVRMCKPYFQSSIEGEWWENRSIRSAIAEEMRLIGVMSEAIWGHSLFRDSSGGGIPIGLNSFLRPTAENFHRFVMALDKLLSENIDSSFFKGKCPMETEQVRSDGKIVVTNKGTLALLQEWLLKEVTWDDPDAFLEVVIKPLRQIRKLRQTPAHTFTTDDFSTEYYEKRDLRPIWSRI